MMRFQQRVTVCTVVTLIAITAVHNEFFRIFYIEQDFLALLPDQQKAKQQPLHLQQQQKQPEPPSVDGLSVQNDNSPVQVDNVAVIIANVNVTTTTRQPKKRSKQKKPFRSNERRTTPQKNIAYVNVQLTGDDVMSAILRRFGYIRNLSFVLPIGDRQYLAWPYLITSYDYRLNLQSISSHDTAVHLSNSSSDARFNILCERAVYEENTFAELMAEDAVYVVSVREPLSHLLASLSYYDMFNILDVPDGEDSVEVAVGKLGHLTDLFKASASSTDCVPDDFPSLFVNPMSFALGLPTGFEPNDNRDMTTDVGFVAGFTMLVQFRFEPVIYEHMDESLVLLRRRLFWDVRDIIYWKQRTAGAAAVGEGDEHVQSQLEYDAMQLSDETLAKHELWSNVDYALYRQLNESLWRRIKDAGADFHNELVAFKAILRDIDLLCSTPSSSESRSNASLTISTSAWSEAFTITLEDCYLIGNINILPELKAAYDKKKSRLSSSNLVPDDQKKSMREYC